MENNDNKNLIIAIVLMLAVWFGFSALFPPKQSVEQAVPATEATTTQPAAEQQVEDVRPQVVSQVPQVPVAEATTEVPARDIVVESDVYRAVFTTSGARLTSFELKEYQETAEEGSPAVQMYTQGPVKYATLRTVGFEGLALAEDASFTTDAADSLTITNGDRAVLTFRRTTASGLEIIKSFALSGDNYTIDCDIDLHNAGPNPLRGTLDFALVQRWDESMAPDMYSFSGPATMVKGEIEEVDVEDDLSEAPVAYGSGVSWTSFQTKYFLSVLAPAEGSAERTRIVKDGEAVTNILETPSLTLQPGQVEKLNYFLYVGPKEYSLLKAAGHQLEETIEFGFFDILAKPLFHVLIYFYGYLKNYGAAIILLTIIIKLIFWPLTHKSYASMKAMQKLQPEMQKIRERFKNDKERLNKELMELYKTHRVNPVGGCLPMFVQIPVFIALYNVLLDAIALRHAPFALWVTDLSAPDTLFTDLLGLPFTLGPLPLLMGASMWVQQKMTPTAGGDPNMAKAMMMMPVVFTFLFLNFPSGLVIYWLVNNLLTIAQQYYIHKKVA